MGFQRERQGSTGRRGYTHGKSLGKEPKSVLFVPASREPTRRAALVPTGEADVHPEAVGVRPWGSDQVEQTAWQLPTQQKRHGAGQVS